MHEEEQCQNLNFCYDVYAEIPTKMLDDKTFIVWAF